MTFNWAHDSTLVSNISFRRLQFYFDAFQRWQLKQTGAGIAATDVTESYRIGYRQPLTLTICWPVALWQIFSYAMTPENLVRFVTCTSVIVRCMCCVPQYGWLSIILTTTTTNECGYSSVRQLDTFVGGLNRTWCRFTAVFHICYDISINTRIWYWHWRKIWFEQAILGWKRQNNVRPNDWWQLFCCLLANT